MKTAIIAVLFLLALPAAASARRRPALRAPRALDRGGQGWLRHIRGDREQGLAHARRRPPDRGLLSRPRHAERARRSTSSSPTARRSPQRDSDAANRSVELLDSRSLTYQQVNEQPGRFRVTKTYATDPARNVAPRGRPLRVAHGQEARASTRYYDPGLGNDGMDDSGSSSGDALLASDAGSPVSSALIASPAFTRTSNGYLGTPSDGGRTCATSAWTGLHLRAERQRRPDRAHRAHRREGRAAARRLRSGFGSATGAGAERRSRLAVRRLRHHPQRVRGRLARLPEPG